VRNEEELVELLLQLFDRREMATFVREGPSGRSLSALVSNLAAERDMFAEVVRALDRRQIIDDDFFDRLIEERPRAAVKIDSVRRRVLGEKSGPNADRYEFDFFISHASQDIAIARQLAERLLEMGASVFLAETNIEVGQDFGHAIERGIYRSRFVVVLLSRQAAQSRYIEMEMQLALKRERRSPFRISGLIPVLLGDIDWSDLPYLVKDIQSLDARSGDLRDAARRLLELRAGSVSTLNDFPVRASFDTQLRDLAVQFFQAAGRPVRTEGSTELSVPEPAWVASDFPASPSDARRLARLLEPSQIGYFLFKGTLPENTLLELDSLRIRGNPIVPISQGAMTSAVADQTASTVLLELETSYRGADNLFDTRNALIDERFLFGRAELLAQVGSALSRGEHVLVFGLRKAGKTSFLNILRQHLARHPFSSIDLQKYDRHTEDWPPLLFHQIVSSFDNWGRAEFADWPARNDGPLTTATELEDALRARRRWQKERGRNERLIVVLDEIERIFPDRGQTQELRQFVRAAGALRNLGQAATGRFVSIIAADLRPDVSRTNRLDDNTTNPFFSFFQELPLPLLSRSAIEEMLHSIARAMGISTVSTSSIQRLYDDAGGHPFLTRMIAGAAYRKRHHTAELTDDDLSAALDDLADRDLLGTFFRENLWGELRQGEREELRAAAKSARNLLGASLLRAIKAGGKHPHRALLTALGLIRDDRIPIGLFAEWLKDTPPSQATAK
jgi:TIR domain